MMTRNRMFMNEEELRALSWVRDGLASGKLKHVSDTEQLSDSGTYYAFNMGASHAKEGCKTVACIGGWMAIRLGLEDSEIHDFVYNEFALESPVYRLFFPIGCRMGEITPAQAVEAIDNFLEHGAARWELIVVDEKQEYALRKRVAKRVLSERALSESHDEYADYDPEPMRIRRLGESKPEAEPVLAIEDRSHDRAE